ncbi:type II toxin-antitoxin system RelE/ParE family toxin [Yersinia kristensenii]|uniref:type II toxin-antitoxin system RelE/ParE family toxin n=1 Tax=Yersinia kristensenii TaxID=28152 RepID=UPI00030D945E|nr:type II toxin-antitoxin system RelE/ParE family toxin [Yersinia kristensenii]MBW5811456.1 type II toxin-antitoxin system RelE/ParE family toxin [Yersinia kristensenii]MBW5815198.1 type II toxin-antitoxin system RelE/ParE family toxin [Yersinia kristensenii]MBW5824334.1 type II toxin-antitoxin system RelE/ParE family toxin [Yersinia kristensenii]MBW5828718.1 type II toxin-antitoxin system RelE/ParE family toxin [Yersinia kristensenii]MBW5841106.1 type II toxin-antitoxin system RelE/ParE fami
MSEEPSGMKIDIYESSRFSKALERLSEQQLMVVEDQIELIITTPEMGELKKGDLSYLRVHKFQLNNQLALLGYSWIEQKIELYLLSLSSHENFYQEQKRLRKADLKLIS